MDVSGKKALVFGGTSGIGLCTTKKLQALGAKVVAISRDPSKAGSLEGVTLVGCDVRDRDGLAAVFEEHSGFDILISAATGGTRAAGPFLEMDLDAFQASFEKFWGYSNIVHLGAPHLNDDGCIVLVSGAPARRARKGQTALAAVGGSVEQFTRAVAVELAPKRINVVAPGVIDTPMFGPDPEQRSKMLSAATAKHVIPRPGLPEEVADGILFVVQNDYVTGTTIDVDGGWLLS